MNKLTIIGSIAFDTIHTPAASKKDILGGSATFASMAASFFSPVSLISVVGTDFPEKYLNMFRTRKISTEGLELKKGETFRWEARYDRELCHRETLHTALNVFNDFRPCIPASVRPDDNLLLANIDPELQEWIFKQIKPRGLVACDTMNLWIQIKKKALLKLLKKVDILLLNDAEAMELSGENNLMNAARYIASKGARMSVIKKGEHGALFFSKGLGFIVPAYFLDMVIDPTGAGDTFAGAMMGYLSSKNKVTDTDLRRALIYGSILASFAVEKFSVDGLAALDHADIEERYRRFTKLTRF
jgi:sugar/nucleoside kinase (ribokinase family)